MYTVARVNVESAKSIRVREIDSDEIPADKENTTFFLL